MDARGSLALIAVQNHGVAPCCDGDRCLIVGSCQLALIERANYLMSSDRHLLAIGAGDLRIAPKIFNDQTRVFPNRLLDRSHRELALFTERSDAALKTCPPDPWTRFSHLERREAHQAD